MTTTFPPLDITAYWAPLNEQLVALLDLVPDDKLDWSPKPELYNFKGILLHVVVARHNWMGRDVGDGEETPDVLREGQTKDGLKAQLRLSWARMERFLSSRDRLEATYDVPHGPAGVARTNGHWLAFHGLEHDIHHRADIFHYLALLGIDHGAIEAP
ncbi:MAG: DinB family protein [Dehalococcoidia bacterium]